MKNLTRTNALIYCPIVCLLFLTACGIYRNKDTGPGSSGLNSDPNFEATIAGLLQNNAKISYAVVQTYALASCTQCHKGASAPAGINLETYSLVVQNLADVKRTALVEKSMPKSRPLSDSSQQLLARWIDQGAPEQGDPLAGPPVAMQPPAPPKNPIGPTVPFGQDYPPNAKLSYADLKPLFAARCLKCHSSPSDQNAFRKPAGGVALDSYELLKKNLADWSTDIYGDQSMPKTGPLVKEEQDFVKRWVTQGIPEFIVGGKP